MGEVFTGLIQLVGLVTLMTAIYALSQVILTIKEERDERRRREDDAYAQYMRELEDWRRNNVQPDLEPTEQAA